jgi:hypothetical protein
MWGATDWPLLFVCWVWKNKNKRAIMAAEIGSPSSWREHLCDLLRSTGSQWDAVGVCKV